MTLRNKFQTMFVLVNDVHNAAHQDARAKNTKGQRHPQRDGSLEWELATERFNSIFNTTLMPDELKAMFYNPN